MAHETEHIRHEESDVDALSIFGFGAGLFVVLVVVLLVVRVLFTVLDRSTPRIAPDPMTAGQEQRLPPEPRLQQTPREDLREFRTREDELLNGYEWVDRQAGTVRIPIGEAMKLTVQRGLPSRPAGGENQK